MLNDYLAPRPVTTATAPARRVSFQVLGRLAISVDGRPVPPPRAPVLQGLLGVLVLARDEPLTATRLAELLWADQAEAASRESVHVGVSRLRKWLTQVPCGELLALDHANGYRLSLRDGGARRLDVCRFFSLVERARSLDGDPDRRLAVLDTALRLRQGPVLDGVQRLNRYDALPRSVEAAVREAALELADAALHGGVPRVALEAVNSLAGELPYDEPLHAALINLHAADGRLVDALNTYQRLNVRIREDLGVDPGEQVQEAGLRLLARDRPPDAGPPSPRAAAARPVPDVPVPAQLPAGVPDFTGRAGETATLTEALLGPEQGRPPGAPAAVMVAGMGGTGKTALAVHVAHLLPSAFPGGSLFADLRGASGRPAEPAAVLGRFLRALGVPRPEVPASLEERTALYRSRLAGRSTLVVLDDAADEEQVRPLLPGEPDSRVLITGRRRLAGLEGVTLMNLDVLPAGQAVELLTRVVGTERIAAEPGRAAEVARLCDHLPMAVRIAGARLAGRPHWTLTYLANVLGDERRRLDELTVGDLAVRADIESSYLPLPGEARRAFRAIGLLRARDFTSGTVATLLDMSRVEAQRHLESLIDAQLVAVVGVDGAGLFRYRVHDLVRLYALDRAENEDPPRERRAALRRAMATAKSNLPE